MWQHTLQKLREPFIVSSSGCNTLDVVVQESANDRVLGRHLQVVVVDLEIGHIVCPEEKFSVLVKKIDENCSRTIHRVYGLMPEKKDVT